MVEWRMNKSEAIQKKENGEDVGNLKDFLNKNSGVLTVLGIFLIFLFVGNLFLTGIILKEEIFFSLFSTLSQLIWFAAMLVIFMCLIVLIKNSMYKKTSLSVKLFGGILFLMIIPLLFYVLFSILFTKDSAVLKLILILPSSMLVSLGIIISPLVVILFNHKKLGKWRYLTNLMIIIMIVTSLLPVLNLQVLLQGLLKFSFFIWFSLSLIISYVFVISYSIIDKIKKRMKF